MIKDSKLLKSILPLLIPVVIILGLIVTLNGDSTPGGGFQGGAILSSVFILIYIIHDDFDFPVKKLKQVEKIFLLLIFLGGFLSFALYHASETDYITQKLYFTVFNLLIAVKVFSGLGIIFFRFITMEAKQKND
jgi:multicomponent Na+:H+ antiporter subunit B